MNPSVVATGIGIVSSLGNSNKVFWENCIGGKSGISQITGFETSTYKSHLGGEIKDFNPRAFLKPMQYRKMSKASRFAIAASIQALEDASLAVTEDNTEQIGIIAGTGYASTSFTDDFFVSLLQEGPSGADPFYFPETVPNAPASQISIFHNVRGPLSTVSHNNVSGELAITYACDLLQSGAVGAVIVCGVDELNPIIFRAYASLGVLSPRCGSEEMSRPFDHERNGIILGEGAAALVLEREDYAERRGARVYGKISGYATSGSSVTLGAYDTDGEQTARAIKEALSDSSIFPEDVDYISAASNSSRELDRLEALSIKKVFREYASRIPVTALKSQTGEYAGMGVLRAAAILLSLKNQLIPPTINLTIPDEQCSLLQIVRFPVSMMIRTVLLNGISFGGANAAIIFQKA